MIDGVPDVDTIINGHWNSLLTWNDLIDYRGFYTNLVDQAKQGIVNGRTAEDIIEAYATPERYSDYRASPGYVARIVNYVYEGV